MKFFNKQDNKMNKTKIALLVACCCVAQTSFAAALNCTYGAAQCKENAESELDSISIYTGASFTSIASDLSINAGTGNGVSMYRNTQFNASNTDVTITAKNGVMINTGSGAAGVFNAKNLTINADGGQGLAFNAVTDGSKFDVTVTEKTTVNSANEAIFAFNNDKSNKITINLNEVDLTTTGSGTLVGGSFNYAGAVSVTGKTELNLGNSNTRSKIQTDNMTGIAVLQGAQANIENTEINFGAGAGLNVQTDTGNNPAGAFVTGKDISIIGHNNANYGVSTQNVTNNTVGANVHLTGNTVIDMSDSAGKNAVFSAGTISSIGNTSNTGVTIEGNSTIKGNIWSGQNAKVNIAGTSQIEGDIIAYTMNSGYQVSGNVDLDLDSGSNFTGRTVVATQNVYQGIKSNIDIKLAQNAKWTLTGTSIVSSLNNSGDIYLNQVQSTKSGNFDPHLLIVDGDYVGGGNLHFSGVLAGDDDTVIDQFHVMGNATGTTKVYVTNIGGMGDQTVDGIKLIHVDGDRNEDTFVQGGAISTGIYDYTLKSKGDGFYVLTSSLTPEPPPVPPVPPVEPPVEPEKPKPSQKVYAPEAMGYISNLYMANNLFDLRFRNHVGEREYVDAVTGEKLSTSLWTYARNGFTDLRGGKGQIDSHASWYTVQFGGDLIHWNNSGDHRGSFHLGLTAGRVESKNNNTSNISNRSADSKVNGWSYGVYATWAENEEMRRGLYVDTSLLWNNLNGSVDSKILNDEYKLRGIIASIDSGYAFEVGRLSDYAVLIEPQAQLIYQDVKARDSKASNGANVSANHGNLKSRLGFRTALQNDYDKHALGTQLFAEASWIHNTKDYTVTFNNQDNFNQDSVKNIGELKVGVEGYLIKNLYVWFDVTGQKGENDYKNAAMALGLQYYF